MNTTDFFSLVEREDDFPIPLNIPDADETHRLPCSPAHNSLISPLPASGVKQEEVKTGFKKSFGT